MNVKTLYRPTGIKEFELIMEKGFKKFPPRLEWQPIFYPVLNQVYAEQIALQWNTKDEFSGYCGIVTRFDITEECFLKYEIQNVGGVIHNELWVPADELDIFNESIINGIHVIKVFFGEQFVMPANEIYQASFQNLVRWRFRN
jgi:hypothetical protein